MFQIQRWSKDKHLQIITLILKYAKNYLYLKLRCKAPFVSSFSSLLNVFLGDSKFYAYMLHLHIFLNGSAPRGDNPTPLAPLTPFTPYIMSCQWQLSRGLPD